MEKKLVSIIIPTFNGYKFIRETIESCLNQTYSHLEIIVIDDGSQVANMKEILNDYIESKKIKYVYQENRGLSAARNTGLKIANGEFIQFLDDDDLLAKDKIEKQVGCLDNNHNIFGVYSETRYFSSENKEIIKYLHVRLSKDVYYQFLTSNFITVHSVLIRKPDIFFDETLKSLEDYDFWLRLFSKEQLSFVVDTYCMVRVHNNNMSSNLNRMLKNEIRVLEREYTKNEMKSKYAILIAYRLFKLKYLIATDYSKYEEFLYKNNKSYIIKINLYKLKQVVKKMGLKKKNIYNDR